MAKLYSRKWRGAVNAGNPATAHRPKKMKGRWARGLRRIGRLPPFSTVDVENMISVDVSEPRPGVSGFDLGGLSGSFSVSRWEGRRIRSPHTVTWCLTEAPQIRQ